MQVRAQQNDTVELLCWRYYGRTVGVTEVVLNANKGISDNPLLQAGQRVYMPEIQSPTKRETVQLWD
ncbi:tail protein X [Serratia microhaemolytica]|uniref:tail protein X n=1 Tax=Serratia microhaemolytica TaxID=2675110 RepID=UPI000FDD39B3|nr:tail protein X [Serratia microhaemolytica]